MTRDKSSAADPSRYCASFFVLRTPLLPYETVLALAEDRPRSGDGPFSAGEEHRARERAIRHLRELLSRPGIREAIRLSSRSLDAAIDSWLAPVAVDKPATIVNAFKYVVRMSSRATPYGLCAGVCVGTIGERTELRLHSADESRRHVTLDIVQARALAAHAVRDGVVAETLRYLPNSTIWETPDGTFRYVEEGDLAGLVGMGFVGTPATEPLRHVLRTATSGATLRELANGLVDSFAVAPGDARDYVVALAESGVLVSEIQPPVTGVQPIVHILRVLQARAPESNLCRQVHAGTAALGDLCGRGPAIDRQRYEVAAAAFTSIAPTAAVVDYDVFAAELHKSARTATLGTSIIGEINRALSLLHRVVPRSEPAELKEFRDRFVERWGAQSVPLMMALDEEHGIPFGAARTTEENPILQDIELSPAPRDQESFGARDRWLYWRVSDLLHRGETTWRLSDDDIAALSVSDPLPLPDSLFAILSLGKGNGSRPDRPVVAFNQADGPSGAYILGRLCHGDERLTALVREYLQREEALQPNAIFAELACNSSRRNGNLTARPTLRKYEIAYGCLPGVDAEHQIAPADVTVSVRGSKITLWSTRLDREVIVRLTSAHDYRVEDLPIYRFLGTLQQQNTAPIGWTWGPLLDGAFVPRVVYGETILHPAMWTLSPEEVSALVRSDDSLLFVRRQRRLPRWIWYASMFQQRLLVDLDNPLAIEALRSILRRGGKARLSEVLFPPGETPVSSSEGHFTNEVVVPLLREARAPSRTVSRRQSSSVRPAMPGVSDWLYLKLYGPASGADGLLHDVLSPAIRAMRDRGLVESWFFVRYADPEWHLRVRVRGAPAALRRDVFGALLERIDAASATGALWRTQLDTYVQEVVRYGGDEALAVAEEVFHADSDASVDLIALLREDSSDVRWRVAAAGIHALLNDFTVPLQRRVDLLDAAAREHGKRLGATVVTWRRVGERYRKEQGWLRELTTTGAPFLRRYEPILAQRSRRMHPLGMELARLDAAGALLVPLADIVTSYVHMFVNRLISSEANQHEMVLYSLLARAYRSTIATGSGA